MAVAYIGPGNPLPRVLALIVFASAVLTDALDGAIARLARQQTEVGSYLDPLADKLLLSTSFVALAMQGNLAIRPPIWVPILFISRDAILMIGWLGVSMIRERLKVSPTILGKLTTATQMLTVMLILLEWEAVAYIWVAAAFLTVISGVSYLWKARSFLDHPVTQARTR